MKIAVVLVGDPDPALRTLAARVDASLSSPLTRPFDPGLRRALRGEPGEDGDGLSEIRRERRRLGLGETADAPILAQLGRRAGAAAVAVVRVGDEGPELVMFDVRAGAFFQGALALEPELPEARITRFVLRRARVSARGAPGPAEAAQAQAERPDPLAPTPEEEDGEPDFFEQYWPYFVAALLLGGMITAIAVTSSADAPDQPVLRFVPGGR